LSVYWQNTDEPVIALLRPSVSGIFAVKIRQLLMSKIPVVQMSIGALF
jgi:hypothetical protein